MAKVDEVYLFDENRFSLNQRLALLRKHGIRVRLFDNCDLLFQILINQKPAVILLADSNIEKILSTLSKIKAINPDHKCIVIGETTNVEDVVIILKSGAFDYICPPFGEKRLIRAIKEASSELCENKKNMQESLDNGFYGIIGQTKCMLDILKKAKKISQTNVSVLIQGESGTGKELLARAIHAMSNRSRYPFIPVSCSSLPPTLIESELFGFEEGSFTNAKRSKKGLIELAHNGTLFLDEIGEINLEMQPKLLRFLQDHKIRRIGALKEIRIDTRIIAATNRNLYELVQQGRFREDLYYRINVVKFDIPPLRERKEDIPLLVSYFIKKFNRQHEFTIHGIEDEAIELLTNYHWPGNVRQLENVIKKAIILSDSEVIKADDIIDHLDNAVRIDFKDMLNGRKRSFKELKQSFIQQFERQYIIELLQKHNGNLSRAAREAGVNRRTIYRMIEQYGIQYK
jgi:DNA-binding NtrC family response regulator